MNPNLFLNSAQRPSTQQTSSKGQSEYTLNIQDQNNLVFLKDKYLNDNIKLANEKCPWEDLNANDLRRYFVQFVKEIAASKSQQLRTHKTISEYDNTGAIQLLQNYFEFLIDNKFPQADNIIKKQDLKNYPQLLEKLNVFSLKMLKYQSLLQENNNLKNISQQLDFYRKIIQNIHEPKSLQNFINLNKKSPYMTPAISYKLQKQSVLFQEKQEFQRICKGYEKVLTELNNELNRPMLDFRYTNIQLSSFSCKDFKSKITQQSGIKLKKSLANLIYNISSSKDKKILTETQKQQSMKSDIEAWTYFLLQHFSNNLLNNSQSKHFNSLEAFVIQKMPNNKSIREALQRLKQIKTQQIELKEFSRALQGISVTSPSSIESVLSMIKPKQQNTQKMIKFFKKQFINKLVKQISSDKIVSGNQTLLEDILKNCKKWIDPDTFKSIQKLALKTGKQRKVLEDIKLKLYEIMNSIGDKEQICAINTNPNTIDFYLELHSIVEKLGDRVVTKKSNPIDEMKTSRKNINNFIPYPQRSPKNLTLNNSFKNQDTFIFEQQLSYEREQCQKLKKQLLGLFGNFQKDLKNMVTTYTVRGGFQITRESFDYYVKKKTGQINMIMKEFQPSKKMRISSPTQSPKKQETNKQTKLEPCKQQLRFTQSDYIQLEQKYNQLEAQIVKLVQAHSKTQNQAQSTIEILKKQLLNKDKQMKMILAQLQKQQTASDRGLFGSIKQIANPNMKTYKINEQEQQKQKYKHMQMQENMNMQIHQLKKNNEHLSFQIQNKNQQIAQLKSTVTQLKTKTQNLSLQTHKLNGLVQERQNQILNFKKSLTQTENKLKQNTKLLSQTEDRLKQNNKLLSQNEDGLKQSRNILIQAQNRLQQSQTSVTQTENRLKQANQQVIQTEKRLKQANKQHQKAIYLKNNQIQSLKNKVQRLQKIEQLYNQQNDQVRQMRINSVKQKQSHIKQIATIHKSMQQQLQQQKNTIIQLKEMNESITEKLQQSRKINSILMQEKDHLTSVIQLKQSSIQQHKKTINELQTQIKTLKHQLQSKRNALKQMEQSERSRSPIVFRSLKQIDQDPRQRIMSISRNKQRFSPLTSLNNQKNEQADNQGLIKQLNEKIAQLNTKNDQLKQDQIQIGQLSQKIQYLQNLSKQFLQEIQQINKQKISLQSKLKLAKITNGSPTKSASKPNQSSKQFLELQSQNDKLKSKVKQLQDLISFQNSKAIELNKEIFQLKQQLQNEMFKKHHLHQSPNDNSSKSNQTLKQTGKKQTQIKAIPSNLTVKFFNQSILENQDEKKQLLVNAIESRTKSTINSTKLIYSYDPLNPTSFHQYIDGKENFFIVIQTKHDKILGAFSTSMFKSKYIQPESTVAFLFTFNEKLKQPITCFNFKNQKDKAKSLVYDEYFIMVGNSEIRWRPGQNSIVSFFGISKAYYDSENFNVEDFLQQEGNLKEVEIKGFQCYQIYFNH